MAEMTERGRIAHLLRRAGFGGTPPEIANSVAMGFDRALERLVDYGSVANDDLETRVAEMESELDMTRLPSIQTIWLFRMLNTARPLEERMTLFWHDHFATANYKVGNPAFMYVQNALFRTHALGSFRELLYGVSRDPAMLRWLDGNSNRRRSPNENYARELLELFTMGVGNYTEEDVREAARAFTGWFFDRTRGFVFNANQHDFDSKIFLGQTGDWDGDDIVNIILEQPITAEFMARRLFEYFVHDHPPPATISQLADTFRRSDYNVRELVRAILRSPEFSSEEAYHALVRSPVEYLVGTMKLLGLGDYHRDALGMLGRMGMVIYNPPDVSGWDWGTGWIGASTLLERLNSANTLTTARGDNARFGLDPEAMVQRLGARTPADVVDRLLDLLVDGDVPPSVRSELLSYMTKGYEGSQESFLEDQARLDRTVRGVTHLIMSTPVYQMA